MNDYERSCLKITNTMIQDLRVSTNRNQDMV